MARSPWQKLQQSFEHDLAIRETVDSLLMFTVFVEEKQTFIRGIDFEIVTKGAVQAKQAQVALVACIVAFKKIILESRTQICATLYTLSTRIHATEYTAHVLCLDATTRSQFTAPFHDAKQRWLSRIV